MRDGLVLTMQTPATAAPLNSYVSLIGNHGLGELGTYEFYYQISNPIPANGSLHVILPPTVTYDYIS